MRTIDVQVTEDHIRRGKRHEACRCPVDDLIDCDWYILPRPAVVFINRFDGGRSVQPFSLKVSVE